MSDHNSSKHGMGGAMPGMSHGTAVGSRPYLALLLWFPVHVALMYVLMFAMIDTIGNFWNNTNMFFMAVFMAAPMTLLMILTMPHMYTDKTKTWATVSAVAVVGVLAFAAIRGQWGVGDRQFLRAMIPHHAGAILMCSEAKLTDPRILELCRGIEAGQQTEIDLMTSILNE